MGGYSIFLATGGLRRGARLVAFLFDFDGLGAKLSNRFGRVDEKVRTKPVPAASLLLSCTDFENPVDTE